MADEKQVLPPALAQKRVATPPAPAEGAATPPVEGAATEPTTPAKQWKFVKNFGVADVLSFPDGTSYTFPQRVRNNDFGLHTNSYLVTSDEKLANNLREFSKNPYSGVVEVSI